MMNSTGTAGAAQRRASKGPMPPHARFREFLDGDLPDRMLRWAMDEEKNFKPAKVFYGEGGHGSRTAPDVRKALRHKGVGPFYQPLRDRLLDALPQIMPAAGYSGPEPRSIEFELNAYGEGAHFRPHIDIPIGRNRRTAGEKEGEDRVISAVYYFYREPKAFTGGALRLFRYGADLTDPDLDLEESIALEPEQNSLIVFPSWAYHSVEPVSCPSGKFRDFRFGLNCWFCRRLSD